MENKKNDNNKRHKQCPDVVITRGCSKFKTCNSFCKPSSQPAHPQPPPIDIPVAFPTLLPTLSTVDATAAFVHWQKARQLEQELFQLDKLLKTEKRLTECLKHTITMRNDAENVQLIRLEDGSYLHEVRRVGKPWGRLIMQVSPPTVAESSPSAIEMIKQMSAMKIEDLWRYLNEVMQMNDLNGYRACQIKGKLITLGTENGLLENILLHCMDKFEILVLEGLKIQLGTTTGVRTTDQYGDHRKEQEIAISKGSILLVLLLQVRDPTQRYEAVGEPMIGFINALVEDEIAGRRMVEIQGVHVAGMKCIRGRSDGKDFIWSASAYRSCGWQHSRNLDRLFA